MTPGVSIILCCYNSSKRLSETLKHISMQNFDSDIPCEVILVDNNSSDNTREVAITKWNEYRCQIPFTIVEEKIPGLSYARERGILTSKYEYLLFCDDDNWLSDNYVEIIFKLMAKDSTIAAVGGCGIPMFEIDPPSFISTAPGPYAVGPQYIKDGYLPKNITMYGAGTAYKRSALIHLTEKGFRFLLTGRLGNKLTTGEDRELGYALSLAGFKQYYSSKITFKHFIPKERLTKDYYQNLLKGSCYSFTILKAYSSLIEEKFFKRAKYKSSFIWSFTAYQRYQAKLFLTYLFRSNSFKANLWLLTSIEWIKNKKQYKFLIKNIRSKKYYGS